MTNSKSLLKKPFPQKPYFFCARIRAAQLLKLNALMYSSGATHADFLNSILNVVDYLCKTGQEDILQKIFGNEFYVKFVDKYLDNLRMIELGQQEKEEGDNEQATT